MAQVSLSIAPTALFVYDTMLGMARKSSPIESENRRRFLASIGSIFPTMPPATSQRIRRGVVAVVNRNGRLLVIRRSQQVVAPGAICFPGGGIEAGESETDALVREVREELGVTVTPLKRLWQSVTPWNVDLAWWSAELDRAASLTLNVAEVESIHWLAPEEILAASELLTSNRDFLQAIVRGEIVLAS
jgi:8-oxo-dGTP diphosphatase